MPLVELMLMAGKHREPISHVGPTPDQKKASGVLYAILNSLVEEDGL